MMHNHIFGLYTNQDSGRNIEEDGSYVAFLRHIFISWICCLDASLVKLMAQ